MPKVPAIHTPMRPEVFRAALHEGHRVAFNVNPHERRLGVAWAQVALETGKGRSVWNWNLGQIKAWPEKETGPWYELPPDVLKPGSKEWPYQRAYVGPIYGAAAYWRLISHRYPSALPYFDQGRPYEAAEALGEAGYFEADPHGYGQTMEALYAEYVAEWPMEGPSTVSWGARNRGLIVGAAAVLGVSALVGIYVATREP